MVEAKAAKAEKAKATDRAAKQHAAEINARRRAEGKETRSTGSIARSQRRAQAHHAAKSKSAPAPDRGRSRSLVREAAPKPAAASSSYEDTEEEAAAGEFLPAAPKAKAGAQLQEPSQPSRKATASEKASPLGARWQGRVSYSPAKALTAPVRGIRRRMHKRVDEGDTDTPRHTVDNGRPVMVPEPDASNPEVDQELEDG